MCCRRMRQMAASSYNTYKKYRAAVRQRYTGKDETSTGVLVTERENFMADDWKQAWQPMIDAVGTDFSDGAEVQGADEVERGAIRRFLEPLQFDCPLHYDRPLRQSASPARI